MDSYLLIVQKILYLILFNGGWSCCWGREAVVVDVIDVVIERLVKLSFGACLDGWSCYWGREAVHVLWWLVFLLFLVGCWAWCWYSVVDDVGLWLVLLRWIFLLVLLRVFMVDVVEVNVVVVVWLGCCCWCVLDVFFSWVFCFVPVLSLLMFWYWVVDGDTGRVGSGMEWRWWYCCCLWCIWGWSLSPLVLFALC